MVGGAGDADAAAPLPARFPPLPPPPLAGAAAAAAGAPLLPPTLPPPRDPAAARRAPMPASSPSPPPPPPPPPLPPPLRSGTAAPRPPLHPDGGVPGACRNTASSRITSFTSFTSLATSSFSCGARGVGVCVFGCVGTRRNGSTEGFTQTPHLCPLLPLRGVRQQAHVARNVGGHRLKVPLRRLVVPQHRVLARHLQVGGQRQQQRVGIAAAAAAASAGHRHGRCIAVLQATQPRHVYPRRRRHCGCGEVGSNCEGGQPLVRQEGERKRGRTKHSNK